MGIKIKLFVFLTCAVLIVACSVADPADGARSLFSEGNSKYKEEKFEEAISAYEKALSLGFESGPLYYNLGNAYFKSGLLGRAILNYLRARRLMPQDADLKSNLRYARSLIKSNAGALQENRFKRFFLGILDSFSLNSFTLITVAFYFTFAILIILAISVRRFRKAFIYANIPVLAALIMFTSLFSVKLHKEFYEDEAVVTERYADCKFEPFIGATNFFTLKEGEAVIVITSEKDWVKVKRFDGKQGWVKRSDVEFLQY